MGTAAAVVFLLSTADDLGRGHFHRVVLGIYGYDTACVRLLLKSIVTLEFKLLSFEPMALLYKVVDSIDATDFERTSGTVHVSECVKHFTIELLHNQLFMLRLQVILGDHLSDNLF